MTNDEGSCGRKLRTRDSNADTQEMKAWAKKTLRTVERCISKKEISKIVLHFDVYYHSLYIVIEAGIFSNHYTLFPFLLCCVFGFVCASLLPVCFLGEKQAVDVISTTRLRNLGRCHFLCDAAIAQR